MSGSTRLSPCASKTRSHPRSPTLVAGNPANWPQILSNRRIFRNFPPIEEILRISLKKERMNSFASFSFTELTDRYRRKLKVALTGVARHHGGDAEELCTRTPIVAPHRFKAPPYNLMQMAAPGLAGASTSGSLALQPCGIECDLISPSVSSSAQFFEVDGPPN